MNNAKAGLSINVDIRLGIIDTIAKSIYADPKVKIREAVANSMDNDASWFIMYADVPSRSICLLDNGKGINRERFEFIFSNIGYGEGREASESNSYFGLGLMSILELGEKAEIITKAKGTPGILRLQVDSKKIFSTEVQAEPIANMKQWLTLTDSDVEERERVSVISSQMVEERVGSFPETFTEIVLSGIEEEVFKSIVADEFEVGLRKLLPLQPRSDESFLSNIQDNKAVEWLTEILANPEFCPTIDVYFGVCEKRELCQIWKYYPDFRKDLKFGATDISFEVKSYKDSKGMDREFAFYYVTSVEDLEERSKENSETGIWMRNKNFLVKEADYLQEPGTRQRTLDEPLKNWLFGEVFHKGMTDFLVVTRNEYNWKSKNFQKFRETILAELRPLNAQLRQAWKNNKKVSDLIITPFQEMARDDNPFKRCYGTLESIGIIKGPEEVTSLLGKLGMLRRTELEDESRSVERLVELTRGEIVLVDDDQIRVVVDPALKKDGDVLRYREQVTNRIVARLPTGLFAKRKVKFLENTFDLTFVAATERAPGVSIDVEHRRIFLNPFNQEMSKYSVSFVEVYIAAEMAFALSGTKEEMRDIMLRLLGNKFWKLSVSPGKYLRALSDELERRLAGAR